MVIEIYCKKPVCVGGWLFQSANRPNGSRSFIYFYLYGHDFIQREMCFLNKCFWFWNHQAEKQLKNLGLLKSRSCLSHLRRHWHYRHLRHLPAVESDISDIRKNERDQSWRICWNCKSVEFFVMWSYAWGHIIATTAWTASFTNRALDLPLLISMSLDNKFKKVLEKETQILMQFIFEQFYDLHALQSCNHLTNIFFPRCLAANTLPDTNSSHLKMDDLESFFVSFWGVWAHFQGGYVFQHPWLLRSPLQFHRIHPNHRKRTFRDAETLGKLRVS